MRINVVPATNTVNRPRSRNIKIPKAAQYTVEMILCRLREMATDKKKGVAGLEKSLEDLEAIVERLESEELPLAEALKEFERGVKLTRECQTTLKEAEQTVEILLKKTADAVPEPFETGDEG